MIRILTLCLLCLYYGYFYLSFPSAAVAAVKPATGSPSQPRDFRYRFVSDQPQHFQFTVDGQSAWEHTLPDSYRFYGDKIIPIDACHLEGDGTFLPATGQVLYDYLKSNPETRDLLKFKIDTEFNILQKGQVFYYECKRGHIDRVHMCPSGSIFQSQRCQPINRCTGKRDHDKLVHPSNPSQYFECIRGQPLLRDCPEDFMFHHDRCEPMEDMTHFCDFFPDGSYLLDDRTRVKCRDGKPTYIRCTEPHTRFFDRDYCEPDDCVGLPDDTHLPLPFREQDPFHFVPGYKTCRDGKIHETKECPQRWDPFLSGGDNLTSLPMVYDGRECSVPTFCENVFSHDPDTMVPVHEFTKHVKNWSRSRYMDETVGYVCEGGVRKRKRLPPGYHIQHYKKRKVCHAAGQSRDVYPIFGNTRQYYDCWTDGVVDCPPGDIFNGFECIPEGPPETVRYEGIPFFRFDPLNLESWMAPWEYVPPPVPKPRCDGEETLYNELYNICVHPDCEKLTFLSQIPELALWLPKEFRAKCRFYPDEKRLKKESVTHPYRFWEQRALPEWMEDPEPCVPGQTLQTGNIVWDSSVFATCSNSREVPPFIFCPNSRSVIPTGDSRYACAPPDTDIFVLDPKDWTKFTTNEIQKILPVYTHPETHVELNKGSNLKTLPPEGLEIPLGMRINLRSDQPVRIQLRYRVTYPPHIAFEYDDSGRRIVEQHHPNNAFLMKNVSSAHHHFTHKPIAFPRYTIVPFTRDLAPSLNV